MSITIHAINITGSPALDFIRKEGAIKQSKELTPEENKFIRKRMRSTNCSFDKHNCFHNSAMLLMSDSEKRIKYIEGVILIKGEATTHAWNEISGKVIDVTLQNFGKFNDISYYGLEIPQDQIKSLVLRSGYPQQSVIEQDLLKKI